MTDLYLSGGTFFGLGDVEPATGISRVLTVIELGLGFAFLALIISYLPPLNQAFATRETNISLLDAKAGSPPTAAEIIKRHSSGEHDVEELRELLKDWEEWAATLLENHLSYPVLGYFRSQHDNVSWLGSLTAILDTCVLVMASVEGQCRRQAYLTFAMARHAVVDLSLVFKQEPHEPEVERLGHATLNELRSYLRPTGIKVHDSKEAEDELARWRRMYDALS